MVVVRFQSGSGHVCEGDQMTRTGVQEQRSPFI